ncbi:hypothetical protein KP22_01715 [Pectobacterium betavasculorum]|uniref:Major facilitator superfamily (MFS) profile domain-containing protein n=2 Tax=Pectobacterium betavasculorum TaxID=55207 RepID=A0A093UF07_9GAMM|nr:hypothetical protein KP22_01715 [Pectobacterium betavasculorum]KFX21115.1 hypothetical protein JV35_07930 [Pectobacterium betavasculorum]
MLSAIAALSTDMYLPLFPVMTNALQTTQTGVQLSLTAFMAGISIGQLLIGPWSDNIGRRSLLIGGMALLTLASIVCALSPSIEIFISARFFQGAGAAPLSSAGDAFSLLPMATIIAGYNVASLLSLIAMNTKRRL